MQLKLLYLDGLPQFQSYVQTFSWLTNCMQASRREGEECFATPNRFWWYWLGSAEDCFFWLTPGLSLPFPSPPAAFLPTPSLLSSAVDSHSFLRPQLSKGLCSLLTFFSTPSLGLPHFCWHLKRHISCFFSPVKSQMIPRDSTVQKRWD